MLKTGKQKEIKGVLPTKADRGIKSSVRRELTSERCRLPGGEVSGTAELGCAPSALTPALCEPQILNAGQRKDPRPLPKA